MAMKKYKAIPSILTSVRISPEFHKLCYDNNIRFAEAMRVGISILLAEKGLIEYDNNITIVRRYAELQRKAATYAQEAANLKCKPQEQPSKED